MHIGGIVLSICGIKFISFDFAYSHCHVRIGTAVIGNVLHRDIVIELIVPVHGSKDISPDKRPLLDIALHHTFIIRILAVHQHPECIPSDVEVSGEDIVLGKLVGDLCIEICECIASADLVRPVPRVDYCKNRQSQSLSPGSSEADIERCPVFPERSFELKASVNEAECKGSVIVIEVSISGSDVHD